MLTPKVLQDDEQFRGYVDVWLWQLFLAGCVGPDRARWGHTGEEDGVSCRLYHYPPQNLDVIILGNQSWCAGGLGWEIHDLIAEEIL
ncbi:MAG: hypothetical protein R2911_11105 [Caldilineaceae bacterium]